MDRIGDKEQYDVGGILMDRPFRTNRLGHLGLYVADVEASHHFYGDLLGFRVSDIVRGVEGSPDPRGRFYTYNSDHHALLLIHNSLGKARDDRYDSGITINQMSFQVGSLEEVVNAHRMLRAKGANIWRIGRDVPGSNWAVYFLDADRHTVELFYGMEQIGWNRRSKALSLFQKYATFDEPELPQKSELLELHEMEAEGDVNTGHQWEDADTGPYDVGGIKLARPFKIVRGGPISLFTKDLDSSIAFYVDTMGFKVTEESTCRGHRIAYLRAGNEHHIVTLAPVELRAELGLTESTTLLAQGLQVGTYRQLRDAVKFLEENGCKRVELPAELHTGVDYAAHFLDPDGHLVQLYYYMEQVGWNGAPRPPEARRTMQTPWPETLDALEDTYADRTFQGPLG